MGWCVNHIAYQNFLVINSVILLWMVSANQVDVAILEVGLGGKFDATNVVCVQNDLFMFDQSA